MSGYLTTRMQPATKPVITPIAGGILQRKCACGGAPGVDGECAACRETRRQRQSTSQAGRAAAPPIVHDVLRSPGQPLDQATRAFMEPRFGHDFSKVAVHVPATQLASASLAIGQATDVYEREAERIANRVSMPDAQASAANGRRADFSQVRVHSDAQAADSVRAVNALAYTVGQDIVLGEGQYAPATSQGRQLLAHELTHVVQQGQGVGHLQRWGMDNAPIGDPKRDPRLQNLGVSPNQPRSMVVTAIDDVDAVGWVESFLTVGEVNFTNLNSMVDNILAAIGTSQMSRLNIQVHGSPSAVSFGNTVVSESNFASVQPVLARLAGHFTSGGFVHLRACDVGQNLPLMRLLAATFGVTTYAGRGRQSNIIGVNLGYIVRCEPDGTCTTQFFQP